MGKVHQQTQDNNFPASQFVCVSKHLHDYICIQHLSSRKKNRNHGQKQVRWETRKKHGLAKVPGQSLATAIADGGRQTTVDIYISSIYRYTTQTYVDKKTRNSWWTWTKDTSQKKTRALRNQNKNKEKSKYNYEIEKREENVKTADEIWNGNWIISMCVCVERLNFLGQR